MRRRLRPLVVALVLLLLLGGGGMIARTMWLQHKRDLQGKLLDVLPGVAQRILNFSRNRVVDGRMVWEVSAREARYHDDRDVVVVSEPVVSFFAKDGRRVALRGKKGQVFLAGRELRRVEMNGSVRVVFGPYSLKTETARYDRVTGTIRSPGEVEIDGDRFTLHGEKMTIQLEARRLTLEKNVRTILHPGKGGGS